MTETVSCKHIPEKRWWGSVFNRSTKRRTTEILTECNNRLTSMIEEQTRLISSLTFENGRNDQIIKDYEHKINKLSNDIGKLEETLKQSKDLQEMQRDKLQNQYYDAQVLTNEKQDLERMKTALEQEKLKLDETIQHKEDELRNLRDAMERLQSENEHLLESNSSLKDDIAVTNQTLYEETVKNKLLVKDFETIQKIQTEETGRREHLEHRLEDLQQSILLLTSEKYKVEHKMEAINECLKYEVVHLRKKINRKRIKEKKLERDKQLILQYYRNQDNKDQDKDGISLSKNQSTGPVEISYAEFLKNKVFNLESQLYRRDQLVVELSDIIREYDPNFTIEGSPVLRHYLDITDTEQNFDADFTSMTDHDKQRHQLTNAQAILQETYDELLNFLENYEDSDCVSICSEMNSFSSNFDVNITQSTSDCLSLFDNDEKLLF